MARRDHRAEWAHGLSGPGSRTRLSPTSSGPGKIRACMDCPVSTWRSSRRVRPRSRPQAVGLGRTPHWLGLRSLLGPTRRAVLSSGTVTSGAYSAPSFTSGRPALHPERPPRPSIQITSYKQTACLSRLRPPRLHPQGRRGPGGGRTRRRPCGYNVLQIAHHVFRRRRRSRLRAFS